MARYVVIDLVECRDQDCCWGDYAERYPAEVEADRRTREHGHSFVVAEVVTVFKPEPIVERYASRMERVDTLDAQASASVQSEDH